MGVKKTQNEYRHMLPCVAWKICCCKSLTISGSGKKTPQKRVQYAQLSVVIVMFILMYQWHGFRLWSFGFLHHVVIEGYTDILQQHHYPPTMLTVSVPLRLQSE